MILGGLITFSTTLLRAQTTNSNTNVDYLTLNLNISLTAYTNGVPETNDNLATVTPGRTRIMTRDVIQAISNRVVFPISKRMHPDGYAIPSLGAGVMTNFSHSAKLIILQGLGTNHGVFFIAIRDGHPAVDYDASDYFDFSRRDFRPATGDSVTIGHIDLNDGSDTSSEMYLGEFAFDNSSFRPSDTTKTAFSVDGFTTAHRTAVKSKGEIIDPSVTRSMNAAVAGTGMLGSTDAFAVLRGNINAGGARHESK